MRLILTLIFVLFSFNIVHAQTIHKFAIDDDCNCGLMIDSARIDLHLNKTKDTITISNPSNYTYNLYSKTKGIKIKGELTKHNSIIIPVPKKDGVYTIDFYTTQGKTKLYQHLRIEINDGKSNIN